MNARDAQLLRLGGLWGLGKVEEFLVEWAELRYQIMHDFDLLPVPYASAITPEQLQGLDPLLGPSAFAGPLPGPTRRQNKLPSDDYTIRTASLRDIAHLTSIEHNAAQLYASIPALAWIADRGQTLPLGLLRAACGKGTLWVATYNELPDEYNDTPIAFLCSTMLDNGLYICGVSVEPQHQTRGLGRLLIETVEEYARLQGIPRVTLSTDTQVSWGAPFYSRLGFREIRPELVGPQHLAITEDQQARGLDMSRRCIMIEHIYSTSVPIVDKDHI
jgi:GNAT superfamily N-acetyltransferase